MDKTFLIVFLDKLLLPIGFKRKGNNWVINGEEINKIVNLQKSQYGNSYYINYSYIIKSLPLNGFKEHISQRLGSLDKLEQQRITDLLNFESNINDSERIQELSYYIKERIIEPMESANSEQDLYVILKNMKHRFTVPPQVLEHFNLSTTD